MAQLSLEQVFDICSKLLIQGEKLSDYKIYLGDDEELNGIHEAYYANMVHDPDETDLAEMIPNFTGKGILLS